MEIKSTVSSVDNLKNYFFVVPDYQREYVWEPEDHVEQFIIDIEEAFEQRHPEPNQEINTGNDSDQKYFLGSIILVKNGNNYEVIDGQQRLTTIILQICAIRDVLGEVNPEEEKYPFYSALIQLLIPYDLESNLTRYRLVLQYDESRDFLQNLIEHSRIAGTADTPSIQKMTKAYKKLRNYLAALMEADEGIMLEFARFFLTKVELVVIETENLSSALKIFETINQRGVGLNAMDLVKNLVFSKVSATEFRILKDLWSEISGHLNRSYSNEKPTRFLRYAIISRYTNNGLKEDEIYKWIISDHGRNAIGLEQQPLEFARTLESLAKRYVLLTNATNKLAPGYNYQNVTGIGYINKKKSRQHLILLLALGESCPHYEIDYFGSQVESFFFYSNILNIQPRSVEKLMAQWAPEFRGLTNREQIDSAVRRTMIPFLHAKLPAIRENFLELRKGDLFPQYKLKYIFGRLENQLREKIHEKNLHPELISSMELVTIFPPPNRNEILPAGFDNFEEYRQMSQKLGNTVILEKDLTNRANAIPYGEDWEEHKRLIFASSMAMMPQLLDNRYMNRLLFPEEDHGDIQYNTLNEWTAGDIKIRQKFLLELALDTWTFGGNRLDSFVEID